MLLKMVESLLFRGAGVGEEKNGPAQRSARLPVHNAHNARVECVHFLLCNH